MTHHHGCANLFWSLHDSSFELTFKSSYVIILIHLIEFLFGAFGVVLNIFLIVTIVTTEELKYDKTFYLTLSLALADIFICSGIVMTDSLLTLVFYQQSEVKRPSLLTCQLWASFATMVSSLSTLNIPAIVLDRYVLISRPLHYDQVMSGNKMACVLGSVWLASLCVAFVPFTLPFVDHEHDHSSSQNNTTKSQHPLRLCELRMDPMQRILLMVAVIIVPAILLVIICVMIYRVTLEHKKSIFYRHILGRVASSSVDGNESYLHISEAERWRKQGTPIDKPSLTMINKSLSTGIISVASGCSLNIYTGDWKGNLASENVTQPGKVTFGKNITVAVSMTNAKGSGQQLADARKATERQTPVRTSTADEPAKKATERLKPTWSALANEATRGTNERATATWSALLGETVRQANDRLSSIWLPTPVESTTKTDSPKTPEMSSSHNSDVEQQSCSISIGPPGAANIKSLKNNASKVPQIVSHVVKDSLRTTNKAITILGMVVGTFLFGWVPLGVTAIVDSIWPDIISLELSQSMLNTAHFTACVNPIVYSLSNKRLLGTMKAKFVRKDGCGSRTRSSTIGSHRSNCGSRRETRV